MKKVAINIFAFILMVGLFSCESDYGQFNRDNRPDVPLNFVNATSYGFDPYIEISNTGNGEIQFIMEIPENSGRTIREITSVAAGATAINVGTLNTAGTYISNPIPGQGNQVIFNTTLEEFKQLRPTVAVNPPANGFSEIAFYFLVTLDNGDTIVSMRARVRVKP